MVKINKVYKDLIDKLERAIRAEVSIEALTIISYSTLAISSAISSGASQFIST